MFRYLDVCFFGVVCRLSGATVEEAKNTDLLPLWSSLCLVVDNCKGTFLFGRGVLCFVCLVVIHIYIYVCGGRFVCLNAFIFGRVLFACLDDETTKTAKYNVCFMLYYITCCTTFLRSGKGFISLSGLFK